MDYSIYYKESFDDGNIPKCEFYDFFISAYDDCDRTKLIFDKIESQTKIWLSFPHYDIPLPKLKDCEIYSDSSYKEDEFYLNFFDNYKFNRESKVCIDITGFIRPHLIYFVNYLYRIGIKKIDFLYSEPKHYRHAEETTFSGFIDDVRVIEGCGSIFNNANTDDDLLIITAGYDDKLISKVSQNKSKIKNKFYILGFPSLQPDMYQESILKMYQSKESIGQRIDLFAPAYDPFITAQKIQDIVVKSKYSNIYLSPLSTKPQSLGILLFYLFNFNKLSINIIFPFSNTYFSKTADGLKKTWLYTFELP